MKSLTAKEQIVLVLCHLMGRRRSFEVGNWVIENQVSYYAMINSNIFRTERYNGSTYSRKWRELKEEDFKKWYDGRDMNYMPFWEATPWFSRSKNQWLLTKEFCQFLRAERNRILRGIK